MNFRELLHNTLSVQTTSYDVTRMNRYIIRFALKHGISWYEDRGNLYLTKGEADMYPCIVAHTDTVHALIDDFVVNFEKGEYKGKDRIKNVPHGVGGDDKVGVFVALNAFLNHDILKAAFFRDEEVGCIGSGLADLGFFSDVTFAAQADRRGNTDVVHSIYGTRLMSEDFAEALRPIMLTHKFSFCTGALTDVYTLRKNGLGVSSFNMSAGYHNAHSSREVVSLNDVIKTVNFIDEVITTLGTEVWQAPNARQSTFSIFDDMEDEELEYHGFWSGQTHYRPRRRQFSSPYALGSGTPKADAIEAEVVDDYEFEEPEDINALVFIGQNGEILNECPLCFDVNIEYDDSTSYYFCFNCMDYIMVTPEEMEMK